MRGLLTSLTLICILLWNGSTLLASNNHPKTQKSRVERQATKASPRTKQAQTKRESRREAAARRELLKRNPRLASVFKKQADRREMDRFDKPGEAMEWYLQKRLPKGEKNLPVERYFQAKEKIKRMKRFSTARNQEPATTG